MKTIKQKLKTSMLACFAVITLYACTENRATENKQHTQDVNITQPLMLKPQKEVTLPGELKAWQQTNIYAKVKGFVKSVNADRGTEVKQGQVLAVLDAPEIRAELDEAKAKLYQAKAELNQFKATFNASKGSYNRILKTSKVNGAVSPNDIDQAFGKYMADSANLMAAHQNITAAQSAFNAKSEIVEYLTVTAPFSGTITERNIFPGTLVGPDEASASKPMFVLENSNKLRLTIAIPEVYANEIQAGCQVHFQVSSIPEKIFEAKLSRNSRSIDESVRSMFAEFDVVNTNHELKKGMYTEVKIPVQRSISTLFVPRKAVVNSMEKTFIIKVDNNMTHWVNVKTGNQIDSLIEVFGNITQQDFIIKNASEEIRDNQHVQVNLK